MEQNKNHNSKTSGTGMHSKSDNMSGMKHQKTQHKSSAGNDNPQNGEDWSNYRNRSLSGNKKDK